MAGSVVMDYCHNVAGLESMADFVSRLGAPHTHRHDHDARRPPRRGHWRFRRAWRRETFDRL